MRLAKVHGLTILLFAFTLAGGHLQAQCSFALYPGAAYICAGTTTVYAVQDTLGAHLDSPWHAASWRVIAPHGDSIPSSYHHVTYSIPTDSPGKYTVIMVDTILGVPCIQTDSFMVVRNPVAKGTLSQTGIHCRPLTTCWHDSSYSLNPGALSYAFDWGYGMVDTSFCGSYDTPGHYYFLLTVTDSLGCYAQYSYQNALYIGGPLISIYPVPQTACLCDTVSFAVSTVAADSIFWQSDGGLPATAATDSITYGSLQNPGIQYFSSKYCMHGSHQPVVVAVDDSTGCVSIDTLTVPVYIDSPLVQPVITVNGAQLSAQVFTADTLSYRWQWAGYAVGADTGAITATQNGFYIVTISNACNSISSDTVIVSGLGLANFAQAARIMVGPDPLPEGQLLSISGGASIPSRAWLSGLDGKAVALLFSSLRLDLHPFEYACGALPKGIYLLHIKQGDAGESVHKIVIE